jgi:hypothetical protein
MDWETLVGNIRDGMCVPFLGAGAARGLLPTGAELAQEVLTLLAGDVVPFAGETRNDLAKASQYAASTRGDESLVKRRVAQSIEDRAKPVRTDPTRLPPIHRTLAALRLPIYLTTNYDDMLELALAQVPGCNARREICRWKPDLFDDVPSVFDDEAFVEDPAKPIVFHLHGHWAHPDSLVLTEDDYIEFLLNVSPEVSGGVAGFTGRHALASPIKRALRKKPLLFVGYSLADVNFLVILRGLLRSADQVQRVAVYLDPKDLPPATDLDKVRKGLEQYFAWKLKLSVFWGTAEEFAKELQKRLGPPAGPP